MPSNAFLSNPPPVTHEAATRSTGAHDHAPPEDDADESWIGVHEEPTIPKREDRDVAPSREPLALVVDDSRDSRDLYVEYLVILGCRVLAAGDGLEGLRIARTCRPDLIVLDISMPIMDGCEMAQHVRGDDRTRSIPILAVTSFGAVWQEAARACGCDVVLEKPTLLDDFGAAVRALTSRAP